MASARAVPFASSLASFAASALLLIWVGRLRKPLSQKLLTRQLWHLALADLLEGTLSVARRSFELFALLDSYATDSACCLGMANSIFLMVSVLVVVHFAFAALASTIHFSRAVSLLSKSLVLVWPFGGILGGLILALDCPRWISAKHVCAPGTLLGRELKAQIVTTAFLLCIATYIASVVATNRRAGLSVQDRMVRRVSLFMVAFVLTWAPFVVFVFLRLTGAVSADNAVTDYLVQGFQHANGLLNAIVYAVQSRSARRTVGALKHARRTASQEVQMRPPPVSWQVGFISYPDQLDVSADTARANSFAEHETQELEQAQQAEHGSDTSSALDSLTEDFTSLLEDQPDGLFLTCFDKAPHSSSDAY